jgi:phage-related protein
MWEIRFYESPRGIEPVKVFIDGLQPQTQAKIIKKVELLEQYGPDINLPHAKHLQSNLYELIIHGRQEVRIFYCYINHRIYLVHGFIKKTQKTPPKEIIIAGKRCVELT